MRTCDIDFSFPVRTTFYYLHFTKYKRMKVPSQIRIHRALEGLPALRKLAAGNVAMLRHLKVFQETALHCQEAELIDKAGETNMDI